MLRLPISEIASKLYISENTVLLAYFIRSTAYLWYEVEQNTLIGKVKEMVHFSVVMKAYVVATLKQYMHVCINEVLSMQNRTAMYLVEDDISGLRLIGKVYSTGDEILWQTVYRDAGNGKRWQPLCLSYDYLIEGHIQLGMKKLGQ